MIIDGKPIGVLPFIVQLRSTETHRHLPGVKTGDMGPKIAFKGKNNGWATFDSVRIPRSNLLSRYTKVDVAGTVTKHGDQRGLYGAMMIIRTMIVENCSYSQAMSLLIGLRYSTVRRQFKNISGKKEEVQLIDYQTQQYKLYPILATTFAQKFGATYLTSIFKQMRIDMDKNNYNLLPICHHFASGMKAVYT
jgi:acyl-CoA oxidase